MKRKLSASLLLAALVLTIGAVAAWWVYAPVNKIKSIVRTALLDPDSAQFTEVEFHSATESGCGYVNAKNKVGGYTGRKLFVASLSGQVEFAPTPQEPPPVRELERQLPSGNWMVDANSRTQDLYREALEIDARNAALARIQAEAAAFEALVASRCKS